MNRLRLAWHMPVLQRATRYRACLLSALSRCLPQRACQARTLSSLASLRQRRGVALRSPPAPSRAVASCPRGRARLGHLEERWKTVERMFFYHSSVPERSENTNPTSGMLHATACHARAVSAPSSFPSHCLPRVHCRRWRSADTPQRAAIFLHATAWAKAARRRERHVVPGAEGSRAYAGDIASTCAPTLPSRLRAVRNRRCIFAT